MSVWVHKPGGAPLTSFSHDGGGTDSSIINEGPGTFFIESNPANANYTITVEDCPGTTGTGTGNTGTGDIVQGNPGGGTDPGGVPGNVIGGTFPHRQLVNTGGIPLLLIAGGVLVAGGLLLMRKVLR